jgi:tRNA (mo5U34)-methyltransferase
LGLDLAAERSRDKLVLQTYTMPEGDPPEHWDDVPFDRRDILRRPSWPAMAFIEHRLAGDPTNWWVPDTNAAEAMVRSAGFEVTERPGHEFWICTRTRPFDYQSELDAATGRR